jgi:hypothetical protein
VCVCDATRGRARHTDIQTQTQTLSHTHEAHTESSSRLKPHFSKNWMAGVFVRCVSTSIMFAPCMELSKRITNLLFSTSPSYSPF